MFGSFDTSTLRFSDNVFTGVNGVFFDDTTTFTVAMKCQVLENEVKNDTGVGVYLGPGTNGCLVVCDSPSDTVRNLGTNNRLVDCHGAASGTPFKAGTLPRVLHQHP